MDLRVVVHVYGRHQRRHLRADRDHVPIDERVVRLLKMPGVLEVSPPAMASAMTTTPKMMNPGRR